MRRFYKRCGKRALDLCIAVPAVVALSPVGAVVAGAVLSSMGRPVVFRQDRPGLGGRLFELYKFRTMTVADVHDPAQDAVRLTALGSLLRRLSLDELPQLWNVVKGEMSLVGPRPLLVEYLGLYDEEQARRHDVLPGITGWAQVNGRNALSWEDKFRHDVWYVDNVSLKLDLKILWATALKVVTRRDVSAAGHATMPKFTGTQR